MCIQPPGRSVIVLSRYPKAFLPAVNNFPSKLTFCSYMFLYFLFFVDC